MRVAYVIGTFSAHPVVMGAMHEFLSWAIEPSTPALYDEMNARCARLGRRRRTVTSPPRRCRVHVVHFASVWTSASRAGPLPLAPAVLPARGGRDAELGRDGRCLATMDFTEKDYDALRDKLVEAAPRDEGGRLVAHGRRTPWEGERHASRTDAGDGGEPRADPGRSRRSTPRSCGASRTTTTPRTATPINQLFHIISSSVFLVCYGLAFRDLTTAMWAGLAALFLRQVGHAVLEPPCHDKEATLLGYNTRNKTLILGTYLVIPIVDLFRAGSFMAEGLAADVAFHWFAWTGVVVLGRVAYLAWTHGPWLALVWFVKLITDPVTDLIAYAPRFLRVA